MTSTEAIITLKEELALRNCSERTRKEYVRTAEKFLGFADKEPDEITEEDVRGYLLQFAELGRTAMTINCYNAALRFFMDKVLYPDPNALTPRMKEPKHLPEILSRDELRLLIDDCPNRKHRAIFALAYGSGLRASEICALRIRDLDPKQKRIFVHDGKGSKDRYTLFPSKCRRILQDYWIEYQPDPKGLLFPGHSKNGMMSTRTAEDALTRRLDTVQLKHVDLHSLRHSFATHLVEDGVSIFVVKQLLGHTSIRTTMIYLQLANIQQTIVSPMDRIRK